MQQTKQHRGLYARSALLKKIEGKSILMQQTGQDTDKAGMI
jgi:hypothetical protein